jgi:hypothetical protein
MLKSTYNRRTNANANHPSLTKNILYLKSLKKRHISALASLFHLFHIISHGHYNILLGVLSIKNVNNF